MSILPMPAFVWAEVIVIKRLLVMITFMTLFCFSMIGENAYAWDFEQCEIRDIVFALSLDTGVSICCDDTVSGKGGLKFSGSDFEKAFDAFLLENRLYAKKSDGGWIISKIRFEKENSLFNFDVYDLTPMEILEKLSLGLDEVITFDVLPVQKLSLHFRQVSKEEIFEALCRRFGLYEIVKKENGIHIAKINNKPEVKIENGYARFEFKDKVKVDVKNYYLSDVLENFFDSWMKYESKEYCFVGKLNEKIERTCFSADSYPEALETLSSQCGFSCFESGGVIYITDGENKNSINGEWKKYTLDFCNFETALNVINKISSKTEVVKVGSGQEFLLKTTFDNHKRISELLSQIDNKKENHSFELKYITPEEFVLMLPPEYEKWKLKYSENTNLIYFTGSDLEYKKLICDVEKIDIPQKRIRYDLLILQYDESSKTSWLSSFSSSRLNMGDRNSIGTQLGSVMSFNLNVVSSFGLTFASQLQSSIEDNVTNVFADTVLYGTSGKQISFENSSIYRYRDNNLDPDTGKPIYTGVTREITSGIKLDVKGRVSGDGHITSTVVAKISRQGVDTSSSTGNPPPTTEKTINTEVCGKSGEPIILSGLLQNSNSVEESRTPGLSKIPLVGKLFKNQSKIKEKSQMVIYLVPHIEGEDEFRVEKKYDKAWYEEKLNKLKKLEGIHETGI